MSPPLEEPLRESAPLARRLAPALCWVDPRTGARYPQVTVLDVCGTSVELNRWYAERAGAAVATVCSNVLTFAPAAPFDLICTHSFIGQFDPESRARLARNW